jgi:hypothetical protein
MTLKRACAGLMSHRTRTADRMQVIKLLEPGENAAEHEITEADRGTLSIILTLDKLEKQIEDIESQLVS